MKYRVVLLEDLKNFGRQGDVVTVSPGFARNWLLPHGKALLSSRCRLKHIEKLKEERRLLAIKDKEDAIALADKVKDKLFQIMVNVDTEGKLYGSVSTNDLSNLLKDEGYNISKKDIVLPCQIKKMGTYKIMLKLQEGITAFFKLEVKRENQT